MRVPRSLAVAVAVACALAACALVGPLGISAEAATSANLTRNGSAEKSTPDGSGGVVPLVSWTHTTGTNMTAVAYGTPNFPSATSPGPSGTSRGNNFFAGGPGGDGFDTQVVTETLSLAAYRASIAAGTATFAAQGWFGGSGTQRDAAYLELDFKDAQGFLIGTSHTIGNVSPTDRGNVTGLLLRKVSGSVPKAARSVYLQLIAVKLDGTYNDGYADNLSVKITTP